MWALMGRSSKKVQTSIGNRNSASNVISRGQRISEILYKVRSRDGLPSVAPHVQHLIGRASRDGDTNSTPSSTNSRREEMGSLDIGDKTQLILQSAHPVRYIIEREIKNLDSMNILSYHTWLTIFGRSLGITRGMSTEEASKFEEKLINVANASECGMFSSDIHQTIVNIPNNLEPVKTRAQFNLGNKYAVLVGDYFAIRCIFFAEKVKSSKVFLSITRGVEDFTSAPFETELIDPHIEYPILLSPTATVDDWINYNTKSAGYFTGGLYAILTLTPNELDKNKDMARKMKIFVPNLSVMLKSMSEIQEFESEDYLDYVMLSPFTFTTLPAVIYQEMYPRVFELLRGQGYKFCVDDLKQLRDEIRKSIAMDEAKDLMRRFAKETTQAYSKIGIDSFYADIFHELVDTLVSTTALPVVSNYHPHICNQQKIRQSKP